MASLEITLTDAAGTSLKDHIVVDLFPVQSGSQLQATADIDGMMRIDKIDVSGGPFYRLMITPANHRIIQAFVSLSEARLTKFKAAVPIDPAKVNNISAPAFDKLPRKAKEILSNAAVPRFNDGAGGFLQGADLYSALDRLPLLKACFLNIVAKANATKLPDGDSVLDHFTSLLRLEQDRLFLKVTAALVEDTSQSNAFHQVSAALHGPMPGFQIGNSFKTLDRYGNLQLTFQKSGDTGSDHAVDVDIDDAQGIEHIFQVVRNSIQGPTNPYDTHEILLQQKPRIDPGFDYVLAMRA